MKWKTKEGKLIEISELEDSHLINIVKMLLKGVDTIRSEVGLSLVSASCQVHGEMASYAIESEEQSLWSMADIEVLERYGGKLAEAIVEEFNKRGLQLS